MRDLVGLIVWAIVELFLSRAAIEAEKITRYGTLIAWAKMLGRNDCASVLQQNLDEQKLTDSKLTTMAQRNVNRKAA
jgi:ferritin-like metal-binding protein YciE